MQRADASEPDNPAYRASWGWVRLPPPRTSYRFAPRCVFGRRAIIYISRIAVLGCDGQARCVLSVWHVNAR